MRLAVISKNWIPKPLVTISLAAVLTLVFIGALVWVRPEDLPQPEPVSPVKHLEDRKAAIYENLRDLQFEYRLGKLSDSDYQTTKQELQRELAVVLASIDAVQPSSVQAGGAAARGKAAAAAGSGSACDHCGAVFSDRLNFCGQCGKPIEGTA